MTGRSSSFTTFEYQGCCTGESCGPGDGSNACPCDEQSVRSVPGLVKVVLRKNFVGVVAETQYHAALAARKLAVQWNPGRGFRRRMASSTISRTASHDAVSVDSRDTEAHSLPRAGPSGPGIHIRTNARFRWRIVRGCRCHVGEGDHWSATQSLIQQGASSQSFWISRLIRCV